MKGIMDMAKAGIMGALGLFKPPTQCGYDGNFGIGWRGSSIFHRLFWLPANLAPGFLPNWGPKNFKWGCRKSGVSGALFKPATNALPSGTALVCNILFSVCVSLHKQSLVFISPSVTLWCPSSSVWFKISFLDLRVVKYAKEGDFATMKCCCLNMPWSNNCFWSGMKRTCPVQVAYVALVWEKVHGNYNWN